MAELIREIQVTEKHRPCWFRDERKRFKGMFHRWTQESEVLPPGITVFDNHPGGIITNTFGIVEDESGRIRKVSPTMIRFADHDEFSKSYWGEEQ